MNLVVPVSSGKYSGCMCRHFTFLGVEGSGARTHEPTKHPRTQASLSPVTARPPRLWVDQQYIYTKMLSGACRARVALSSPLHRVRSLFARPPPVVDIAEPSLAAGEAMLRGVADTGYFAVRSPAVDQPLIDAAFGASRSFFALPLVARQALAWRDPVANRGYYHINTPSVDEGQESVGVYVMVAEAADQAAMRSAWLAASKHPSLGERSHADLVRTAAAPNPWPTETELGAAGAEQFRAVIGGYHASCMQVGEDVLSSLALALGASPGELLGLHRSREHTVELKCFPVLPAHAPSSSVAEYQSALMAAENDAPDSPSPALERSAGRFVRRVGSHTDFCSLTLLALPRAAGAQREGRVPPRRTGGRRAPRPRWGHARGAARRAGGRHSAPRRGAHLPARVARRPLHHAVLHVARPHGAHRGHAPARGGRSRTPAPGRQRPKGGDLCGDLVLDRHEAILASRMQLFRRFWAAWWPVEAVVFLSD